MNRKKRLCIFAFMIFVSGSIKIIIRSFLLFFCSFALCTHTHTLLCRLLLFLIAHIFHRQQFLMNTYIFHRSEDICFVLCCYCREIQPEACDSHDRSSSDQNASVFLVSFFFLYRKLSVLSRININLFRRATWIHIYFWPYSILNAQWTLWNETCFVPHEIKRFWLNRSLFSQKEYSTKFPICYKMSHSSSFVVNSRMVRRHRRRCWMHAATEQTNLFDK